MADTSDAGAGAAARGGHGRLRVAVVFGGRSSEHAISCVSAGSVLRALDRDAYDVVPVGITTDGRWVLAPDDPERLTIESGKLPAVDSTGAQVVLAGDPTSGGLVALRAGQRSAGARRRRRGAPAAARTVRRGRDAAGPARAGRRPVRGLRGPVLGGRDGQERHEGPARRGRSPGRAVRRGARPRLAVRGDGRADPGRPGTAAVRQAGAGRVERGRQPGRLLGRPRRRRRRGPSARPQGRRRAGCGRARDRVRRAGVPGRARAGVERLRGDHRPRRPRLLRLRGQVHRGGRRHPARRPCGPSRRRRGARARDGPGGVPSAGVRGVRPGGLLRRRGREHHRQRAEHHPRLHARCRCSRCCGPPAVCRTRSWWTGCCGRRCASGPGCAS